MVIFVIFIPGMLNSSSIFFYKVNNLGIGTKWRQQNPGNRTIKTSGTLWTDEYLQVVMTSQNVDLQELQILLKEGGGGGGIQTHFSDQYLKYFLWNSYQVNTTPHLSLVNNGSGMAWCRQATSHYMSQCLPRSLVPYGVTRPQWVNLDIANYLLHVVWICPGNGLVPIRQQAFNRTHDDKDKMFKTWLHCINSNWKYAEYCNKKCTQVVWLIFYMKQLIFLVFMTYNFEICL